MINNECLVFMVSDQNESEVFGIDRRRFERHFGSFVKKMYNEDLNSIVVRQADLDDLDISFAQLCAFIQLFASVRTRNSEILNDEEKWQPKFVRIALFLDAEHIAYILVGKLIERVNDRFELEEGLQDLLFDTVQLLPAFPENLLPKLLRVIMSKDGGALVWLKFGTFARVREYFVDNMSKIIMQLKLTHVEHPVLETLDTKVRKESTA
jgi:hypothetical protein